MIKDLLDEGSEVKIIIETHVTMDEVDNYID